MTSVDFKCYYYLYGENKLVRNCNRKRKEKNTICVQQGLFGLEGPSSRWPITNRSDPLSAPCEPLVAPLEAPNHSKQATVAHSPVSFSVPIPLLFQEPYPGVGGD
jgi:hypothetical protein